jgi:hypothetical protein
MARARDDAPAKLGNLVRPGIQPKHRLVGRDFTAARDDPYRCSALDHIDRRPLADSHPHVENQGA